MTDWFCGSEKNLCVFGYVGGTDAFIEQTARVLSPTQVQALRQLQAEQQASAKRAKLPKSSELPRNSQTTK